MKSKVFFTTVFILLFNSVYAQTCCSGGIPLSNSIGLDALEKGTFQVGLHYDYNNLNTLKNGTTILDDDSRQRITHSVLLNLNYDITDNLSIEGLFTWVNQRRRIAQFENVHLDQSSGVGDGILLAKYNFSDLIGKNSAFRIGLGAKLPIGSTTETNEQGIVLNADMQPGSGAWDFIFLSTISKSFEFRPTLNFSSKVVYRSTGTNDSYFGVTTYRFGNELQLFVSFSDQFELLNTVSTPSISLKYRDAKQDKIGGFNLENTGGNWVFIIPDFSIYLTPNIIFSTKAELPIYSNVDGTQLTPTYRITAGLLLKIPPKGEKTKLII